MALDLFGSSDRISGGEFGHGADYDLFKSPHKATLFVFRPYAGSVGDVGMRPLLYRFDDQFLNDTQEIAQLTLRGNASHGTIVNNMMSQRNFNDYMLPSYSAEMMLRSSHLSDKWRFILILSDSTDSLVLANTITATPNGSQMRRIYTGYFEDEPFNTFSLSRSLNPHCFMVITHKTVVGTTTEYSRFGRQDNLRTFDSEEIVRPELITAMTTGHSDRHGRIHLLTPENCLSSVDTNEDGVSLSSPGIHSDITNERSAVVVPDVLSMPSQNVGQLVKGVVRYQDEVLHRRRININNASSMFDDSGLDDDFRRRRFGQYLSVSQSRHQSPLDLDVNDRISTVDLDRLVNNDLQVHDFSLERPLYAEVADQEVTSQTNQYSFLISTVVVALMAGAGVNEFIFDYQVMKDRGLTRDEFVTHRLRPVWTISTEAELSIAKALEVELTNGIFKTIFDSKGDFAVQVRAQATGTTSVKLSLVDQGIRHVPEFHMPSFLGGMITPLVGNDQASVHNSSQLEGLYSIATGSSMLQTDDDRDFADYAAQKLNFQ